MQDRAMVSPVSPQALDAAWNQRAALDAARLMRWREHLQREPLGRAWSGAALGLVLGVAAWVLVALWLQYQVGAIALGYGMLVGWCVKVRGRSVRPQAAWIAAGATLVGVVVAHVVTVVALTARQYGAPPLELLAQLPIGQMLQLVRGQFDSWDPIIYAVAIHWAYTGSLREMTDDVVRPLAVGREE